MMEISPNRSRNVKHRRDGDMFLRWVAAGMLAAQQQGRRVRGYA